MYAPLRRDVIRCFINKNYYYYYNDIIGILETASLQSSKKSYVFDICYTLHHRYLVWNVS